MHERLETLEEFSEEHENLSQLFADAHPLVIDAEGRVVLPEKFKQHAGIEGEIAFVGRGATFQMWDPTRYDEHSAMVRDRQRRQGTTLPPRRPA
jgi:MraZ protein